MFRLALARDVLETGRWTDPKLVYYRDGISTTVSVDQWSGKHYSLKNNGKVDASTGDDMPTQITVGLLPMLVHPRAPELRPDVALIGYASGVTAGAILQYPVRRLDVVELEPAIIEASAFFEHVNNRPLDDKRLRLLTDDGRNFLAAGSKRYDVIINEPSNPWITGVSNLFTQRLLRDRPPAPEARRHLLHLGPDVRDLAATDQVDLPHLRRGLPPRLRLQRRRPSARTPSSSAPTGR